MAPQDLVAWRRSSAHLDTAGPGNVTPLEPAAWRRSSKQLDAAGPGKVGR